MPTADVNGVSLYYEVTGEGYPLILAHEAANDYPMWEPQVRFFSRRYKVITYNQRGFPPSSVPEDIGQYSQDISAEDLHQLMRHLGIQRAHIAGLATGSNIVLTFAIKHPEMVSALVTAGPASGSDDKPAFQKMLQDGAARMRTGDPRQGARNGGYGQTRVAFLRKDPRGWEEWVRHRGETVSVTGAVNTSLGVLAQRPTAYELEADLKALQVPTLVMVGDDDQPCLNPAVFLRRCIPNSGLVVFPQSGHPLNLEEPDLFNRFVLDFLTTVEQGGWIAKPPPQPPAS